MHAAPEDLTSEGAEQRCGEHRGCGLETPRVRRISQSLKELGVSERREWNLLLPLYSHPFYSLQTILVAALKHLQCLKDFPQPLLPKTAKVRTENKCTMLLKSFHSMGSPQKWSHSFRSLDTGKHKNTWKERPTKLLLLLLSNTWVKNSLCLQKRQRPLKQWGEKHHH